MTATTREYRSTRDDRSLVIAAGLWTTIAAAAVVVHVRRAVLVWEPASPLGERLSLGFAIFAAAGLAFRLARPVRPGLLAIPMFAAPLSLVLGLVPSANGFEFAAWSLLGLLTTIVLGRKRVERRPQSLVPAGPPEIDRPTIEFDVAENGEASIDEHEPEAIGAAGVPTHATERFVDEIGETISGRSVVRFEAGQRLAALHVPFLPVFARLPHCEAEVEEGDATVKVTANRVYGARLELRRGDVDAPAEVRVAWSAWLPIASTHAGAAA